MHHDHRYRVGHSEVVSKRVRACGSAISDGSEAEPPILRSASQATPYRDASRSPLPRRPLGSRFERSSSVWVGDFRRIGGRASDPEVGIASDALWRCITITATA